MPVKRLALLLLLTSPAWATYNFARRATIVFPAASGSTTDSNITLVYAASDSYLKTAANGGAIRSTSTRGNITVPNDYVLTSDSTCATLAGSYTWGFESYSASGGTLTGWVKIPSLAAASPITIYACLGDSGTTTYQGGAAGSEWDTAYKYVWHMSDNAATTTLTDSTSNGTSGTNSVNTSTKSAAGKIGQGLTYVNASSNYTSVTSGITLGSETDHISFWIKATQVATTQGMLILGNNPADGLTGLFFQNYYNAGAPYWRDYNGNGYSASLGAVTSGAWVKVDILRSDTHDYLYINGSYVLDNNVGVAAYNHTNLYLGNGYPTSADAVIDELHVRTPWPSATKAADDDWIATEYVNQSSPPMEAASTDVLIDFTVSGPSTAYMGFASGIITVSRSGGNWSAGNSVTVSDGRGSSGGTIASGGNSGTGSLTVTPGVVSSFTLTYTPNSTTTPITLTYTNNYGGGDPSTSSLTVSVASLSFGGGCPTSGTLRTASSSCTVTLTGGTFNGSLGVTIFDGANLGTISSGGSSAQNALTVTPASGSTFTFTYNPYLVGVKPLTLTNAYGWTNPSALVYTSSSADVCTFTAKADGNWASAGTWTPSGCTGGGHATPDSGDAVVITGYHVTVPFGTTAYLGSCPANNTADDLTLAPTAYNGTSGVLEIAGTLRLCGNTLLSASAPPGNYTGVPSAWPILQLDTGAELDLDNNYSASVAYRMVSSAEWGWGKISIGNFGDACNFAAGTCPTTIKAVNLNPAMNPNLYEATVADALVYRIYGLGVSDCGSASKGCLEYQTQASADTYTDAGIADIEGSIFQRTGTFQAPTSGVNGPVPSLTLSNDRFLNDLAGVEMLDPNTFGPSAKPCSYSGNYFSGAYGNAGGMTQQSCAFIGNVFVGSFGASPYGAHPLGAFMDNVIMLPSPGNTYTPIGSPNFQRNITIQMDSSLVSYHGTMPLHDTVPLVRISDNLCFLGGGTPGPNEAFCSAVTSTGSSTLYVMNNISLPAPATGLSAGLWAFWMTYSGPLAYVDHNAAFGLGHGGPEIVAIGHDGPTFPTAQVLQSYRANLHWASSGAYYPIGDEGMSSGELAAITANSVNTANIGWNAMYNQGTASTFGVGFNTNCSPSTFNGTPYKICATTGGPQNDILNTNPNVIDNTRNPFTWASRMHGQAATVVGMETYLQSCQSLIYCIEEMRTWTARGFQPTNLALKGKAHDGRMVGFTGTYGSGYSGSCTVTFTPQDAADLGTGAAATCSFVSGVPVIQITNPGANYRIAMPATVAIGGTCTGGCVAASLTPVISPHDIGPVQMALIPGVM